MRPLARVLRQPTVDAYAFGSLGDPPVEPAAFKPMPEPDPPGAFVAGREAGLSEAEAQIEALKAEVSRLSEALDHDRAAAAERTAFVETAAAALRTRWDEAVAELEAPLVELAVGIAESVLDAPLSPAQRSAAAAALAAGVDAVGGSPPVTVSLHPVDLLRAQETGFAASLEATHPGLQWEANPALVEGDWGVSTSTAAIQHIRADMLAALRSRLSISPAS